MQYLPAHDEVGGARRVLRCALALFLVDGARAVGESTRREAHRAVVPQVHEVVRGRGQCPIGHVERRCLDEKDRVGRGLEILLGLI